MEYKQRSREEKIKFLTSELEDIRKAKAVLERFEKLTQQWLERQQRAK